MIDDDNSIKFPNISLRHVLSGTPSKHRLEVHGDVLGVLDSEWAGYREVCTLVIPGIPFAICAVTDYFKGVLPEIFIAESLPSFNARNNAPINLIGRDTALLLFESSWLERINGPAKEEKIPQRDTNV